MKEILRAHYKAYPKAELSDFIKLLYQSEFGGGHLISDPIESLKRLTAERETAKNAGDPPFVHIGGGLCRVSVFAAPDYCSLKTLNGLFVESARAVRGSAMGFLKKTRLLAEMAKTGELPFSGEELRRYLKEFKKAGYPPVSHSAAYKEAYSPAYRVVLARFLWPGELFRAIERGVSLGLPLTVAIDGNCGSGKTTLAELLKALFPANVFHMDDFFLPPDERTKERLAVPGENVDHERFLAQVLLPLKRGEDVALRSFSCEKALLLPARVVKYRPLNIIEGSYALQEKLRPHYDLKVALHLNREEQLRRISKREADAAPFIDKWIPLEDLYFYGTDVFSAADLLIDGNTFQLLPTAPSPDII